MNNPRTARRAVSRRDKHTCQSCGKNCRGEAYDIDHVKPLFEANNDPSYWQLGNLRLLCKECHKDKTREDMVRFRASQVKDSNA
jgi:5-methylcytosine-specific restriction endonuclease McrA